MCLHLWDDSSAAGSSMSLIPVKNLAWDEMSSLLTRAYVNYASSKSLSSLWACATQLCYEKRFLLQLLLSRQLHEKFAWQTSQFAWIRTGKKKVTSQISQPKSHESVVNKMAVVYFFEWRKWRQYTLFFLHINDYAHMKGDYLDRCSML